MTGSDGGAVATELSQHGCDKGRSQGPPLFFALLSEAAHHKHTSNQEGDAGGTAERDRLALQS